jgi:hypothetical protein
VTTDSSPAYGSGDHARMITFNRHPGVQTAFAWLAFSHLPTPLQGLSRPLYEAACELIRRIPNDSAELTTALNTLVETKDWMVRAGIRSDQGQPGPVPRPAEVVDPPSVAGDMDWSAAERAVHARRHNPIDNRIGPNFGRPIQDRPQA